MIVCHDKLIVAKFLKKTAAFFGKRKIITLNFFCTVYCDKLCKVNQQNALFKLMF